MPAPRDAAAQGKASQPAAASSSTETAPCKFFGSAKGCSNEACTFSHDSPNSVQPCKFKQTKGHCDRGEACPFRHQPWSSAEQARAYYASREGTIVDKSSAQYKRLHRDMSAIKKEDKDRLGKEHVEMPVDEKVEKEIHTDMYGSNAMRMMEKMGYKAGVGLGKTETGKTQLVEPLLELEKASSQLSSSLGFGHFESSSNASLAMRAAKLADAKAQKRAKLDPVVTVQHNLLDESDSSEGEDRLTKGRHVQL
eukprot:TRINITY_DN112767_c0_g1_i1.p1 TRINITY_DN112767_c0_g1~~TRINITY_DN112767_c0_g1_i1.p1  ORF type:complete len:252 (+),score=75.16 TRINITY_DN112767_c0_g1_i1:129-884(+)